VDVPKEAVASLQRFLGFGRAVIVQSSCHGTNHSALLDALASAPDRLRGVALIDESTPLSELARLDAAGVRGFRLNFLPHLGGAPRHDTSRQLATRAAELGWHAEIHVAGDGLTVHKGLISSLPGPVVIDHLGRVDISAGLSSPAVVTLLELLDTGQVWVKLSGVDRVSRTGPPYADAVELAALLVRHAPERVLWGTDYPHPNIVDAAPDDGLLVDLIAEIAPTGRQRRQLLVDNPADLFGFPRSG
jgi:predicted TIM-barrel fold metal-dependent hydrolase